MKSASCAFAALIMRGPTCVSGTGPSFTGWTQRPNACNPASAPEPASHPDHSRRADEREVLQTAPRHRHRQPPGHEFHPVLRRPSCSVRIMEFVDGKVAGETLYFGDPFKPGPSRARWVQRTG